MQLTNRQDGPVDSTTRPTTRDSQQSSFTIDRLSRWSCSDHKLPPVSRIKCIHIYDFDNTLFASPQPSQQLWTGLTVGQLCNPDIFIAGGWWHDVDILAATGGGAAIEEARAWRGWWNESIVKLVELSMQEDDTLTILLTGRAEAGFADLIKRMVKSRSLNFHMVCLKPDVGPGNERFPSTMSFKQALISSLAYTYTSAESVTVYEDRVPHVKAFRQHLAALNQSIKRSETPVSRIPFRFDVVQVAEQLKQLDSVTEVAQVQRAINAHNTTVRQSESFKHVSLLRIKRSVSFTGYLITPETYGKLRDFLDSMVDVRKRDVKVLANSIIITPKPASKAVLAKAGGLGKHMKWRITGLGIWASKLWAVRVEPSSASDSYYTENDFPTLVLGLCSGARPVDVFRINQWQSVSADQAIVFDTVVGERALLQIVEDRPTDPSDAHNHGNKYEKARPHRPDGFPVPYRDGRSSRTGHPGMERKRSFSADSRTRRGYTDSHHENIRRGASPPRSGGYRGQRGGRDLPRGGRARGRGGGYGSYRSLDDVDGSESSHGYASYDSFDRNDRSRAADSLYNIY